MFYESLIALNTTNRDPNMRGESPLVIEIQEIDPGAMVAGVIATDAVSKIGKGKGEVWGGFLLNSLADTNEPIGCTVATHSSTAGKITITLNSSNSSSTVNLGATKVLVVGKLLPVNPS